VFTIEQIEELHRRLGSAETLADYVRSLADIGVVRYDSYVSDGHSEYFGHDGHRVTSQPVHEQLSVAVDSDRTAFLDHLRHHERGDELPGDVPGHGRQRGRGVDRGYTRDDHDVPATDPARSCRLNKSRRPMRTEFASRLSSSLTSH